MGSEVCFPPRSSRTEPSAGGRHFGAGVEKPPREDCRFTLSASRTHSPADDTPKREGWLREEKVGIKEAKITYTLSLLVLTRAWATHSLECSQRLSMSTWRRRKAGEGRRLISRATHAAAFSKLPAFLHQGFPHTRVPIRKRVLAPHPVPPSSHTPHPDPDGLSLPIGKTGIYRVIYSSYIVKQTTGVISGVDTGR